MTNEIANEYRFYLLRKRVAEQFILAAFRAFRKGGIEPILIKGWAAGRNYPESKARFASDIDLAVSAANYDRARGLMSSRSDIAGVDLHCELRHLDTVYWERLVSNSELVELDGEKIRILCAEDHLRVMCVHWLTNGGENRERLWDIVYAVQNRPADFDWSKCLNVVGARRRKWIVTTIGIAHKYMDLELEGLPFADEARALPIWITRCLEKEWVANVELLDLHTLLASPRRLMQQINKRLPPNPIQATIDCEGDFGMSSPIGYQLRNIFRRLVPSVRRISSTMAEKSK